MVGEGLDPPVFPESRPRRAEPGRVRAVAPPKRKAPLLGCFVLARFDKKDATLKMAKALDL